MAQGAAAQHKYDDEEEEDNVKVNTHRTRSFHEAVLDRNHTVVCSAKKGVQHTLGCGHKLRSTCTTPPLVSNGSFIDFLAASLPSQRSLGSYAPQHDSI
jgi:hypothetical protein